MNNNDDNIYDDDENNNDDNIYDDDENNNDDNIYDDDENNNDDNIYDDDENNNDDNIYDDDENHNVVMYNGTNNTSLVVLAHNFPCPRFKAAFLSVWDVLIYM